MTNAELTAQAVEEIGQTEARRVEALLGGDVGTLSHILSDGLTYTHANGRVDTKAQYLASIESGHVKYLTVSLEDTDIRVYGTAAVVTGRVKQKLRVQSGEIDLPVRFTMTYVRLDGRWQAVAWQATRLAD